MKKGIKMFLAVLAVAAVACMDPGCKSCNGTGGTNTTQFSDTAINPIGGPVTGGFTFGSGTGCVGKGICAKGSTAVTVNTTLQNNVSMAFSISQDTGAQGNPAQGQYWRQSPPAAYSFDYPYDVSTNNPLLAKLQLTPGTVVLANANPVQSLSSNNDTVTITLQTGVSKSAVTNIIFGTPTAANGFNPSGLGIYSCSPTPIQQFTVNGTPVGPSIAVTCSLQANAANNVVLNFNMLELATAQPMQVTNFVTTVNPPWTAQQSYPFSISCNLAGNPAFNGILFPQNAVIPVNAVSSIAPVQVQNNISAIFTYSVIAGNIPKVTK